MKKIIFSLLLFAFVGAFAFTAKDANAAVAPSIPVTSTLSVISPDGSKNFSVTDGSSNKWYDRAQDAIHGTCDIGVKDDLYYNTHTPSTYRIVSQIKPSDSSTPFVSQITNFTNGSALAVLVWFSNSADSGVRFSNWGTDGSMLDLYGFGTSSTARPWGLLSINNAGEYRFDCGVANIVSGGGTPSGSTSNPSMGTCDYGCFNPRVTTWVPWAAGNSGPTTGVGFLGAVFYNSFTTIYPGPDYPSEEPPYVPPGEPVEPSDQVPKLQLLNVVDFKGTFSDANFATYDEVPFLCLDDLAPALHYEIYRETPVETLITSGVISATGQLEFQFTRSDQNLDYRIVGYYDCGDSEGQPIFDESSYADFTITRGGIIESTIFEDCMNADFPFVHFDECIANLYTTLNLISFNTIGFNNSWNSADTCYNLVVLDDWLHITNPTVCPQVPSFVRTIITPFVTLLLGLVTITFLARNRGSNW